MNSGGLTITRDLRRHGSSDEALFVQLVWSWDEERIVESATLL